MANYLEIIASAPFTDASSTPINGVLTVTPSCMFRTGGGGQCDTTSIVRRIIGGVLVDGLVLANPALTSPQNVGYTFALTDARGAISTWESVLIQDDGSGNYDLAMLDTGQFTAVPQCVVLVHNNASTGDFLVTQTGNMAVSAFSAVALVSVGATAYVIPASSTDTVHSGAYVGLAMSDTAMNQSVNVQVSGQISNSTWTWTPGQYVYLGADGALTQTAPQYAAGAGYLQIVGKALSTITVQLAAQPPSLF